MLRPHIWQNLRSFRGLRPLDPYRALPWTPWGGLTALPAVWAMTVGHCVRATGTHSLISDFASARVPNFSGPGNHP